MLWEQSVRLMRPKFVRFARPDLPDALLTSQTDEHITLVYAKKRSKLRDLADAEGSVH